MLAPHQRNGVGAFVANSTSPDKLRASGLFPASMTNSIMDDLARAQNVPLKKEPPLPKLNFHLEDAHPDTKKVTAAKEAFSNFKPFEGKGDRGDMALTFNCLDYNPVALKTILDNLKENGVASTFYVTEEYLKEFPGSVKNILEHGHEIAGMESVYNKSASDAGTVEKANALSDLFKEKTGLELTPLVSIQ